MSCNDNCNQTCCCQQQTGTQGATGPQGPAGPAGPIGPQGADGAGTILENFYEEFIQQLNVSDSLPNPGIYHFPPGYEILTFTNNSGSTKNYLVKGSYDTLLQTTNVKDIESWVDGAIIKTVGAVDTVEWQNFGRTDAIIHIYDGPLQTDVINIGSIPDEVFTSPGNNPVEIRFGSATIPRNVSFFKKISLNDGETVSLMFKCKDDQSQSILLQAQIFVEELSQ